MLWGFRQLAARAAALSRCCCACAQRVGVLGSGRAIGSASAGKGSRVLVGVLGYRATRAGTIAAG